jgi:hypothetical protein
MRGHRSLVGVIAAALLFSSLGVLGAAGPAVAGATAAPAATSISIRSLKPTIQPSQTVTIAGNMAVAGGSAEGRAVALEARTAGEDVFTPIGIVTADAKGGLTLVVRPEVTTHYRWHYAGAADARPRFSGEAVVRVRTGEHPARRAPTTLSIRAIKPMVAPGGKNVVRGTLRTAKSGLRGRYVVLLARTATSNGWQFRAGQRTKRLGQAIFTVRPRTDTTYRLAFAGAKNYQPSRSGTVTVGVRPTVTIVADPPNVDPGSRTVVTGTVVRSGSAVAGATVDLLAKSVGSKGVWAVVGTASTAADGSVSIAATPAGDTRYRLRVNPAAGLPAGWSRVIEVDVLPPSSLSIRGEDVAAGFAISGQLRAKGNPVGNEVVTLQTYDPATKTWSDTATARTSSAGVAQFIRPSAPGTDYRLLYVGKRFASSTSATLTD